jgi:hypothetical protein
LYIHHRIYYVKDGESQEWTDLVPHIQWFYEWFASCEHTVDNTTEPSEHIPHQCWFDLRLTCATLPLFTALYFPKGTESAKCAHLRHIDQDIVEGFFGKARGKSDDRNMDARSVMAVVRDEQIATTAYRSQNANVNLESVIVEALKRRQTL